MSLTRQLQAALVGRRGWSLRQPRGENVVLLLTGGLDSSLLAEMCLKELKARVFPLYVRRGSRAEVYEEQAAWQVVKFLQDKYGDDIQDLYTVEAEIPPAGIKAVLPLSYLRRIGHPVRNSLLQLYGVQRAVMLSQLGVPVSTVVSGSIAGDVSPDGSLDSLLAITLTVCIGLDDWRWQVLSPYLMPELLPSKSSLGKKDIIVWGKTNDFPMHLTRSCTDRSAEPCGQCAACLRRNELFRKFEVNHEDPIVRDDQRL